MPKLDGTVVWVRWGLSITAVIVTAWVTGFLAFIWSLPRADENRTPVADGIVVLTGEFERLKVATTLLREGAGERLLVSGVGEGIGKAALRRALGESATGADKAKGDLFSCCIDTGRLAQDTEGNAAEIADWAKSQGYQSICVVTASYHMPRALLEIRRRAPDLSLIPHPVFLDKVVVEQWWAFPGTARALTAEFNKYLIALVRAQLVRAT